MAKFDIGPLHIETTTPLRGYHVTSHPSANVTTDIEYEAFTDPFVYSLDFAGAEIGKGHYESIGRATGTITVDGQATEVEASPSRTTRWDPPSWAACVRTVGCT